MFQLVRSVGVRQFLGRQAPVLTTSFLIAEAFYKFHSFTLECGAFLATWFALDAAVQVVVTSWKKPVTQPSTQGG